MQLWTEYEGRTIAGTYTLGRLLRSEGRNGFFSTADNKGEPAVIRLTEAHFDEDELLKRWRQVADMHQDNLINIERFGQTNFDGLAITYALMEANDANLADVLQERPMTVAETTQVARAVHAALTALHASGMVHEHIEPSNVLAVGETVKLRSDCVRECIADTEFNTPEGCAELRRRDIHDFGMLLLQCLTLEKRYNAGLNLPDSFRRMIPNMLEGAWSLEQIGKVLNPEAAQTRPAISAVPAVPPPPPNAVKAVTAEAPAAGEVAKPEQAVLPLEAPRSEFRPQDPRLRSRRDLEEEEPTGFQLRPWLLGGLAALVVCVLVIWHFASARSAKAPDAAAVAPQAAATAPVATPRSEARSAAAAPATAAPVAAPAHAAGWYVIAYTYNHREQALAKAERVNAHERGFHAEVFSPRGRAPFLVSLGGPMSEREAKSLQQRARRSGLPRDTFIRNYR